MKIQYKNILILFIIFFASGTKSNEIKNPNLLTDILLIADDNGTSVIEIKNDMEQAGYNVDVVIPDLISPEMFENHRLVILSTGSNLFPCVNNFMRSLIQIYVDDGGKLIVEGGQTGYVSDIIPEYPAFKSKVIKILSWQADNGGGISISDKFINSKLATIPNLLSPEMDVDYSGPADMDVCINNEFSELFYKTKLQNDKVGILAFPSVADPQIINYFFCYAKITEKSKAKNLLNNSVYNLIGKPIGINSISSEIPESFMLYQNYPNPFNPSTVISYSLRFKSNVTLIIYDILGNEIQTLIKESQNPGTYSMTFNGNSLADGVYYYRLTAGELTQSRKMLLIK